MHKIWGAQIIWGQFPRMSPLSVGLVTCCYSQCIKTFYFCHISTVFLRKISGTWYWPVEIRSLWFKGPDDNFYFLGEREFIGTNIKQFHAKMKLRRWDYNKVIVLKRLQSPGWSTVARECWVATGIYRCLLSSARSWAWQRKCKPS